MAQKNRTKELWLIPKRVNLHQTICLIDGILERKYDGTSWNPQKQNNLGVNLKKWGSDENRKKYFAASDADVGGIHSAISGFPVY